ncbi:MAG TPA: cyclic nucleotide-binding domain-containing protein [Gammaproteobacteria bacterium]|nr:cyclic nucleotide-binding domain-containing protein [Gammaproteobacteria bacterium]
MLRASVDLLRQVPIFGSLSPDELQRVVDAPANGVVSYRAGELIVAENDVANCMYIVLDGAVDVRITAVGGREITIATLKAGEFFGEQALLPGSTGRRNATVRALSDCRLFRIGKGDVALGLAKTEDFSLSGVPEEANDEDRVRMLLRSVRLFRSLSPRDLERVGEWTETVAFDDGDIILREAEEGDFMYVVLDGAVEVFVMDDDGKILVLGRLTAGHYFGEQALLPGGTGKRNANVRADGRTTLVRVAKRYFQLIVNHDNKLMLALKAVGDAQRRRISDLIGRGNPW